MSNRNLAEVFQHSLRVAIGATTVLIETLQDPCKRSETFEDLQTQFNQKTEEWSLKGELTEQEMKRKIEEWLNQIQSPSSSSSNYTPTSTSTTTNNQSNSSVEILTEQIIALKKELENLRHSK